MQIPPEVRDFIATALREDSGHGDITSEAIIEPSAVSKAVIIAKERAVIAGLDYVQEVFYQADPSIEIICKVKDSQNVKKGDILCDIKGSTQGVLKGERIALNILQRLSGIATFTARLVKLTQGFNVKVVDTRKTTPCMRYMEKYAVRMGGGFNHRFGLFDGILIKDNHIKAAKGISKAVKRVKTGHHLLKVEVEVKNIKEVRESLRAGVDVIMLDNMSIDTLKQAVQIIKSHKETILIEVSGNITANDIGEVASTGVDLISVGALTHSAPAVDLSLNIL